MAKTATIVTTPLPYSWTFHNWPEDVFPHDGKKARHLVALNIEELRAAGAIVRPGRSIVVIGSNFAKWLASKADRVTEWTIAPNDPEHASKRFGGVKPGRKKKVAA